MANNKRGRDDVMQRIASMPPVDAALQGDSILNVGVDFTYPTLQGLSVYPAGISTVQYEVVAQLPRTQGVDLRVFAMMGGRDTITGSVGSLARSITASLTGSWSTMVQTGRANVAPTVAFDQSSLVINSLITVAADNISGGNTQIVMGSMRSGIIQDFTGDLYAKIESTTVQTKNKLQENCLSRAIIRKRVVTSPAVYRVYLLTDILSQPITWIVGRSIVIVASWAAGYFSVTLGTDFGLPTLVNMRQEIPYGVLPYFWFGDNTLTVIHVIAKWGGIGSGLTFAFILQPFESLGMMPPRGTDGTWVASIVVGCSTASLITLSGLTNACGYMRMSCPTSIPSIAFTGLTNNIIYMNGSAFATAPPANSVSESYGAHPPTMAPIVDFFSEMEATIGVPTTSADANTITFY